MINMDERNRRMKLAQTLLVKAGFLIYEYGKEKGAKGNWAIFKHLDGRFFGAQEIYNISLRRLEQFREWAK